MKSINLLAVAMVAFVALGLVACDNESKKVKSPQYDLSYAYGSKMGDAVARFGLSVDERNADKFAEGFMKGLEGDSLDNVEAQEAIQNRLSNPATDTTDKAAAMQIAYYMGLSAISPLAQEVEVPASDFDKDAFAEGFRDVVNNDSLKIDVAFRDSIFQAYVEPKGKAYQTKMQAKAQMERAKMEEKAQAEAPANIAAGQAFLEKNKKESGVKTTASGLQYKVLKKGTGKQATIESVVLTDYHGTLIDGTVFDSSVDRGQPAEFPVGQVIQGWQEGIPLMKEGAKYRFFIPQELAYGMQSPSPKIPAGSTLIFDVDLLEVKPAPAPAPALPTR